MEAPNTKDALKRCFGLTDSKADETIKNDALTQRLLAVAKEAGVLEKGSDKNVGNLLYEVAVKIPDESKNRTFLSKSIAAGDIRNKTQLTEALAFLKKTTGDINEEEFKQATGVGVVVTPEQIEKEVSALLKEKEKELETKQHDLVIPLLKVLREKLKWGNPQEIKAALEKAVTEKCGPKGDKPKAKAPPKEKAQEKTAAATQEKPTHETIHLHKPQENERCPAPLLKKHLEETGGRVVTRFPPEPNGYLHIGHVKAMNINFGYARKSEGWCYLRFDDTNPDKESQEYINSIVDNVKWLGHTPYKITYASEYFPQLYEFAKELIRRGKAFVCHQTPDEIKAGRKLAKQKGGKPTPSPWRDRPIEESLKLFEDMRKGKFDEGAATLRMKQDLDNPNPCMWDHVAYRIKYTPHPHAGDRWCIYPTYDYTHCICDSLENITHSLCSLEFEVRRESYNWLLDALDIYRSPQIEYSRMNVTHCVVSKRKLIKLVQEHYVSGWDDPRMPTVNGLRRRGFTADALNDFVERAGFTRAPNLQHFSLLEEICRQHLDSISDRRLAVLHPLRVELTNYPEGKVEMLNVVNHPTLDHGTRQVPFSRVIYIDRSDFRLDDSANFFRLAPGKEVRLKYAYIIKCTEAVVDKDGNVTLVKATYHPESQSKLKGNIQWVAESTPGTAPLSVEVREYSYLFKSQIPPEGTKEQPIDFLLDLNPASLNVLNSVYVEPSALALKVGDRVQFEREGFYILDKDTAGNKLVFNRTVALKEDKLKDKK